MHAARIAVMRNEVVEFHGRSLRSASMNVVRQHLVLLLAVAATVGCVTTKKPRAPAESPNVKVDAESWADGSSQNAVERMKEQREEHLRQVFDQRQEFEPETPATFVAEKSVAPIPRPSDDDDAPRDDAPRDDAIHVSDVRDPLNSSPIKTASDEPPQPIETLFTADLKRDQSTTDTVLPAAHLNFAETRDESPPANVMEIIRRDDPAPPETVPSVQTGPIDSEMGLRLKGIVAAGQNTRLALLEIAGKETLFARAGDVFELDVNGERTTAEIVGIDDNSIRVRVGNQGRIRVVR